MKSQFSHVLDVCPHVTFLPSGGKRQIAPFLEEQSSLERVKAVHGEGDGKSENLCKEAGCSSFGRSQAESPGTSEDHAVFAVTEWVENWHQ